MSSDELVARVREAARGCVSAVSGQAPGSPAAVLAGLARACEELGIEEWDGYGDGGAVTRLEAELVDRFGVEAAAFFPSGVMAQQAALRVHCDGAPAAGGWRCRTSATCWCTRRTARGSSTTSRSRS